MLTPITHSVSALIRRLVFCAPLLVAEHAGVATAYSAQIEKNPRGREAPLVVGFEKLSAFPYTIVDAGTGATPEQIAEARKRDQVPAAVRAYHDKRIVITGYLMPIQLENGLAKKFILMKDINTCCYGATPNMNDYVVVEMKGEGVKAVQDVPVELIGVLHIGEKYEGGYLTSLFHLDGEKFPGTKKW